MLLLFSCNKGNKQINFTLNINIKDNTEIVQVELFTKDYSKLLFDTQFVNVLKTTVKVPIEDFYIINYKTKKSTSGPPVYITNNSVIKNISNNLNEFHTIRDNWITTCFDNNILFEGTKLISRVSNQLAEYKKHNDSLILHFLHKSITDSVDYYTLNYENYKNNIVFPKYCEEVIDLILSNNNSPSTLLIINELWSSCVTGIQVVNRIQIHLENIPNKYKNTIEFKQAFNKYERLKKYHNLETAPPLVSNTVNNEKLTVDFSKNDLTLVDFWASWCIPCREEHPKLKLLYDKYRKFGFDIVGVSLDTDKTNWLDAIEKDEIPWLQLSDLSNQSAIKSSFGVVSVPEKFLVDSRGKIVLKGFSSTELETFLKQQLIY